ncbi:MAG: hypothetical protein ACK55D_03530 [Synechococcaceae cyanobacterium]
MSLLSCRATLRQRRWMVRLASLLLPVVLAPSLVLDAKADARRLRDWILRWLGNPPIAVGGTRGAAGQPGRLCLLHPLIQPDSFPPEARLLVPRPALVSATPLARIVLRNADGEFLAQEDLPERSAVPGTSIPWPQRWPSLAPGRQYLLDLQTRSNSHVGTLLLTLGSAQEFQQQRDRQASLGSRPEAWRGEISRLLHPGEPPTGSARAQAASLLFSPQAPASPELQRLRDDLRRGGCAGSAP